MQKRNYFLIGLISIMLLASIISLIVWKNSLFQRVKSYQLIGEFESISGLLENSLVKYRGFPIGRVTKIVPNPKNIEVFFFVDSKYNIPTGSEVKIVFDGLVGEKYMEIVPNQHSKTPLEPNSRLTGFATSGLADFIDVGTQNLLELRKIIENMASVFGDQEVSNALKEVVLSLRNSSRNMNRILKELTKISSSQRMNSILEEADVLLKNINQALNSEDYQKIGEILENFEQFSADLKDLTGDGQLKTSILSTLDETRYTFEQSSNFFQTVKEIKLLTGADFYYKMGTSTSFMVYVVNLDFKLNQSYLNLGFSNYSETDKLMNLTLNTPLDPTIMLKYGLIKSSPGFGFKYFHANIPIASSLLFYNIEDPFIDFQLDYKLMKRLNVISGYNELNKNSRSVFLGLSFQQ